MAAASEEVERLRAGRVAEEVTRDAMAAAASAMPQLRMLLREFETEVSAPTDAPFADDDAFFRFLELRFAVRTLVLDADNELSRAVLGDSHPVGRASDVGEPRSEAEGTGGGDLRPHTAVTATGSRAEAAAATADSDSDDEALPRGHPEVLAARITALEQLSSALEARCEARVAATSAAGLPRPRFLRVVESYKLSKVEVQIFAWLAVAPSATSQRLRSWINAPSTYGSPLRSTHYCMATLTGASALAVEAFTDDARSHVKEGVLILEDTGYDDPKPKLSSEAILMMRGATLKSDQALKLSDTVLSRVMAEDAAAAQASDGAGSADTASVEDAGGVDGEDAGAGVDGAGETKGVEDGSQGVDGGSGDGTASDLGSDLDDDDKALMKEVAELQGEIPSLIRTLSSGRDIDGARSGASTSTPAAPSSVHVSFADDADSDDDESLKPYESSLSYLDDQFQKLAQALRVAQVRRSKEMKEAGTGAEDRSYYRSDRARVNKHEVSAKYRLLAAKIEARLKATAEKGLELPRLEILASKLGLDAFEKSVVIMLIAQTISPVVKAILREEEDHGPSLLRVRTVLETFCESFKSQIEHRVYFYKSSRLVRRGLVKLAAGDSWRGETNDLVDSALQLDRRMLDWIVGLDTEIDEVQEGSSLYTPTAELSGVILPEDLKRDIMVTVENFDAFRDWRKRSGLTDGGPMGKSGAGLGLVTLFHGPSGTGKTLMVNAIAHHLKKRVLLVNFPLLEGARRGRGDGPDLLSLFREAEMNDAVLFFDECESVFVQRGKGGSTLMTQLLTQLERHDGIVMLATNRAFDLDEAMYRRITSVFEFKAPDHLQRAEIWKLHTQSGVPLADDIDWEALATKYELAGGFIRNALVSALLLAIARDSKSPVVSEEDLVHGCAMQVRGSMQMRAFSDRVVPKTSLEDVILPTKLVAKLKELVDYEKARSVLFGQWGFNDSRREKSGTPVLFWGPPGTGKSAAAEAVGFEIGRPLKVVDFLKLLEDEMTLHVERTGTGKGLVNTVFDDARLQDAILVLDNFAIELFSEAAESDARARRLGGMLLNEMSRFTGCVILSVTSRQSLDVGVDALSLDFMRRVTFCLEFTMPSRSERERLWRTMLPDKVPVADDIDFEALARSYKLAGGGISSAVYRAAAAAALRPSATRRVAHGDLDAAAKKEVDKTRSEARDMYSRLWS